MGSGKAPTKQAGGLKFKPQYFQKKRKKEGHLFYEILTYVDETYSYY
jgi:hypothetical protein